MTSLSSLQSMDPYDFEELVGDVWSAQGYKSRVRQGSNDKGVDIEATSGNHKILIQAKRYGAKNKVGGPEVRNYATLYQQNPTANQVIIVTTSSFTSQAKEIAAEQNVTLINGRQFINMMYKYNISRNNTGSSAPRKENNIRKSTSNKSKSQEPELGKVGTISLIFTLSALLALPTSIITLFIIYLPISLIFPNITTVPFAMIAYSLTVLFWIRVWWNADKRIP